MLLEKYFIESGYQEWDSIKDLRPPPEFSGLEHQGRTANADVIMEVTLWEDDSLERNPAGLHLPSPSKIAFFMSYLHYAHDEILTAIQQALKDQEIPVPPAFDRDRARAYMDSDDGSACLYSRQTLHEFFLSMDRAMKTPRKQIVTEMCKE